MRASDAAAGKTVEEVPTIAVGERTFTVRSDRLCLNFVNTVDDWYGPRQEATGAPVSDFLSGYGDLLEWGRQAGAISDRATRRLRAVSKGRPEEAERVFRRATRLRSALHDVAVAASHDHPAAEDDLAIVNQEIGELLAVSRLEPAGEAYVLARPGERDENSAEMERVLWPVIRSAIALLTSPEELARVRECPGEGCGWLFYDASGRRRWCSMASCGTVHKVRRFRERQRAAVA